MVNARSSNAVLDSFVPKAAANTPAISHGIVVQGVILNAPAPAQSVPPPASSLTPPVPLLQLQSQPALLQMNDDDFPARFLTDLTVQAVTRGSTVTTSRMPLSGAITLYQPVQRIVHVALLKLTCDSLGFPRVDPTRVDSAGLVVRRIRRCGGVDLVDEPPSAWMRSPQDGTCGWVTRNSAQDCMDPDPSKQPLVATGQPALDQMLAAQTLAGTQAESFTPAFVAPPAVCNAAASTFVYAVIPTASSEISTLAPVVPTYGPEVTDLLPTLLSETTHIAIMPNHPVDYHWMSDEFANAHDSYFLTFSKTLRLLYTVLGAFDVPSGAPDLLAVLNNYNVYTMDRGTVKMGDFYQIAASCLIDYDPFNGEAAPTLIMPHHWDSTDPSAILATVQKSLAARSSSVTAPSGRFQDPSRLYRVRIFLRIKGHTPDCPTQLVWSNYSDPFRIAAWHEGGGRVMAPVPLPDPTDKNFRANAKANCYFAVPAALMNLMQGSSLSGLSSGSGPNPNSSGGINLNWICGFNIPLITICAFFVLNIFLILLNLVFFWLPFIKICIPFPVPAGNSGESDGE